MVIAGRSNGTILSYPILSYPILSYPILSYPILSYIPVQGGSLQQLGSDTHSPQQLPLDTSLPSCRHLDIQALEAAAPFQMLVQTTPVTHRLLSSLTPVSQLLALMTYGLSDPLLLLQLLHSHPHAHMFTQKGDSVTQERVRN